MSKGQQFKDDFKKQIVRLNQSVKEASVLSKEYDISVPTIYKWIKESNKISSFTTNDNLTDEQRELKKSRKRIAEIEMKK